MASSSTEMMVNLADMQELLHAINEARNGDPEEVNHLLACENPECNAFLRVAARYNATVLLQQLSQSSPQ